MNHTRYVARRRAKFQGCNGQQVNIPYGSILEAQDGFLLWKGQPLCVDTSQNAHDFFSQNDDDLGLERGALVAAILSRLETPPNASQKRRIRSRPGGVRCGQMLCARSTSVWSTRTFGSGTTTSIMRRWKIFGTSPPCLGQKCKSEGRSR